MKGSSFPDATFGGPSVEEITDMAPSRNPELVLESRSCDATDEGESFAGGMPDRWVAVCAICSFRISQTFTGGCGGVMASEAGEGCPFIVGGCPLANSVEFVSVDRTDGLEVDVCRIEGADRLAGCLGLGGDTFMVVAGLEGPEVPAEVLAETPFTAGLGGKLSVLE